MEGFGDLIRLCGTWMWAFLLLFVLFASQLGAPRGINTQLCCMYLPEALTHCAYTSHACTHCAGGMLSNMTCLVPCRKQGPALAMGLCRVLAHHQPLLQPRPKIKIRTPQVQLHLHQCLTRYSYSSNRQMAMLMATTLVLLSATPPGMLLKLSAHNRPQRQCHLQRPWLQRQRSHLLHSQT